VLQKTGCRGRPSTRYQRRHGEPYEGIDEQAEQRYKLALLIGALALLLILIGGVGMHGMTRTDEALEAVYENNVVPIETWSEIHCCQLRNRPVIAHSTLEQALDRARSATTEVETNTAAQANKDRSFAVRNGAVAPRGSLSRALLTPMAARAPAQWVPCMSAARRLSAQRPGPARPARVQSPSWPGRRRRPPVHPGHRPRRC
jgi:hypothetical protein